MTHPPYHLLNKWLPQKDQHQWVLGCVYHTAGSDYRKARALMLCGVIDFRRARTTLDPRTPQASQRLVFRGVYSHSRNPMYLGMLLLIGLGTYLASPVAMLLTPAFVLYLNRYQIAQEERDLLAKFGIEFERYCRQVRRWI
ncbi:isoprenylcysteine carboxylmethyltransferase family protein [Ferrimonas gelatinilytica]|uniref:Isoprenylcysteine carboxylmethyltransferase family protein n=1 Tax=Ferrimonas gelatinilytica TaxID=1255257 RepID=A0ABP9SGG5_9GAMM